MTREELATLKVLADALMEERIRGKLDSDTTFEKDIIPDVKCILTVNIKDRRPCYCGAELKENTMIYQCDACQRIYEINRTDVLCMYCGACRCHPYIPREEKEEESPH